MGNKKSFEAIIGVLVLLFCFLFFTHILKSNENVKREKYKDILYAKFNNIDGIKIGTEIKIAGVRVGYVEDIKLDTNTFQVKVKMDMSENLNIPDDSTISVSSSSLLGDKFLSIDPGISDTVLLNGSSFTNTKSSINIEDLVSKIATSFAK
jgi:phospholipid/cholesterol/gamma-HCH transport system substrate-binding protein